MFLKCHLRLVLGGLVPRKKKESASSQTLFILYSWPGAFWKEPLPLGDPVAFCFKLQEICCSLRLTRQRRRNLSSLCHLVKRPILSPHWVKASLRPSHLTPSWMMTAAQLVASPPRNLLPWPPAPQRDTLTGSTLPSNAQSWTCKSFPALTPILELRPCGDTQLKALERGWNSMCLLKFPALSSTEVSWKDGEERPEVWYHPRRIFLLNTVVQ